MGGSGSLRRKQVRDLTASDLEASAIWEVAVRAVTLPNSGNARPRPRMRTHDSSRGSGLFVVRTHFTLRDGTSHVGYSSPVPATDEAPDDLLGYLAPAIATERGQVPFWFVVDSPPEPDFIDGLYHRLARRREEVWPVTFSTDVETHDDEVDTGTINEFQFLVSEGSEFNLLRLR